MKLDAKDFKRLQWAIAFLILMGAIGGGSVWTALQIKKSSERALKEATAARSDIQTKLARARDEQAELRDKIDQDGEAKLLRSVRGVGYAIGEP